MSALWRGGRVAQIRIVSGLVLFAYALLHFLNIGFALVAPNVADLLQTGLRLFLGTFVGTVLLYGALLTHVILALAKIAQLRRFRLPVTTWIQYGFGLLIPVLLLTHIVFTRVSMGLYGTTIEFGYIAGLIWNTPSGWRQAALLLLVWIHGCIGLHMWLRMTAWWRANLPLMAGIATFVPVWALAGFLTEGRRVSALLADPAYREDSLAYYGWPDTTQFAQLVDIQAASHAVFYAALAATAAIWLTRKVFAKRGTVRIQYVGGPEVATKRGPTLLEISRSNDVPHAALCGGRGRCSTCRVIVEDGAELLAPPSPAETKTLAAVNAPPGARLACQIRPTEPMTVFRVFRPEGGRGRAHASLGEERQLAILFLDIRGFTARTAGQFPYDVVFLLNRFFDAVVPQITGVGGSVDKYLGDGLLAVFDDPDPGASARAALKAATGIGSALQGFNATLSAEGGEPVRIGIGVHLGELVMGEIGAAGNAPKTIIGDTVNAASRLEGETKTLGVELLVSGPVLDAAGYDSTAYGLADFTLRGRDTPLPALSVKKAAQLFAVLDAKATDEPADAES